MKVKKDFICIWKQETFSPVSSINTDAIPDFVAFFRLRSGTASSFICEISSLVTAANREAILLITYASLNSTG